MIRYEVMCVIYGNLLGGKENGLSSSCRFHRNHINPYELSILHVHDCGLHCGREEFTGQSN